MKEINSNNASRSETEWNSLSHNTGEYNRAQFFGGERIRVTFSQKMEDTEEKKDSKDFKKNHIE